MLLKDLQKEFEFHCQCRRLSDKTVSNYFKQIGYLLDFLENEHAIVELDGVEPTHIKKFLMWKTSQGRKAQYVNDLLKAFKVFFRYLYEEGYTETLLTERIKNLREPKTIIKTFSNIQIKKMVECYNGFDFLSLRNRAIMAVFFDTGIRLTELLTLQETQIKDAYMIIHGKGNKERVVPKSPYVAKLLFKYMAARQSFFAYKIIPPNIFLSRTGKMLTHEAVERVVKEAGKYARVGNEIRVSPHTCRHTYAQVQLRNGLDLYTLSRLLGHESIAITQRYLEGLKDTEVISAAAKTSPLMNL